MLMLAGALTFATAAHAGEFPKNWADFEKLSFKEMQSLPDVKVALDKKMSDADLEGKSEVELILMKNSIYAQHGFRFSQKALANYFLGRKWYKADFESQNVEKLSTVSRENVELFMKHHSEHKEVRGTAGDHSWDESQLAYNLFRMGFCTYTVDGDSKAGMVVFEPGGVAHVFHSKASRSAFEPYAYENYLDNLAETYGIPNSLMIEAKWYLSINNDKADVLIRFADDDLNRYRDRKGNRIIQPGVRHAVSVNFNGKPGDMYPWVKSKTCMMDIISK